MLAIAPERGAYYRIGACPYLSRHHDSAPVRGAEFDITMNYAPLTGAEIVKTTKRRGKPLRYNLSSLRDSLAAKFFLPDANNFNHEYYASHEWGLPIKFVEFVIFVVQPQVKGMFLTTNFTNHTNGAWR